jgi:hypothetical protein
VYVEDLAVSGLARGRLAKSVHDAGWSAFVAMVEYKATKHGRVFARIGRFEPTTRTCSGCGWYGPKLELSVRTFHCPDCGLVADRDVNAARNILAAVGIFGVHTEEDVNVGHNTPKQLRYVVNLIENHRYPEPIGRRLHATAAELLRLAGWSCFEAGGHAQAQRYWVAALYTAHAAWERATATCAYGTGVVPEATCALAGTLNSARLVKHLTPWSTVWPPIADARWCVSSLTAPPNSSAERKERAGIAISGGTRRYGTTGWRA